MNGSPPFIERGISNMTAHACLGKPDSKRTTQQYLAQALLYNATACQCLQTKILLYQLFALDLPGDSISHMSQYKTQIFSNKLGAPLRSGYLRFANESITAYMHSILRDILHYISHHLSSLYWPLGPHQAEVPVATERRASRWSQHLTTQSSVLAATHLWLCSQFCWTPQGASMYKALQISEG